MTHMSLHCKLTHFWLSHSLSLASTVSSMSTVGMRPTYLVVALIFAFMSVAADRHLPACSVIAVELCLGIFGASM